MSESAIPAPESVGTESDTSVELEAVADLVEKEVGSADARAKVEDVADSWEAVVVAVAG